jgi:hypothetical protein
MRPAPHMKNQTRDLRVSWRSYLVHHRGGAAPSARASREIQAGAREAHATSRRCAWRPSSTGPGRR